ncbi:MAG: LEA type 2 family protein [bacterium]|nr:LEA type 2 family protein [bacterium]
MKRRIVISAITIAILTLSFGCKTVERRKNLEKCDFDLESVEIMDVTLTKVNMVAKVKIYNPNDDKVILDRMDYKIYSEKTLLAEGSHRKKVEIASGASRTVSLSINSELKSLGTGILNAITGGGETLYTIMGTAYIDSVIGTLDFPFETQKKM